MHDGVPDWSVEILLETWQPRPIWRKWFSEAFALITRARSKEEQIQGLRTAATILGDTHACPLCLFVCLYGRSLLPETSADFLGHIDLCLWEMGLATPSQPGLVALRDIGKPDAPAASTGLHPISFY
jgi:hypothetical protein